MSNINLSHSLTGNTGKVASYVTANTAAQKLGITAPVAVEESAYNHFVGTPEKLETFLREAHISFVNAAMSGQSRGWFLSEKLDGEFIEVPFYRERSGGFVIGSDVQAAAA